MVFAMALLFVLKHTISTVLYSKFTNCIVLKSGANYTIGTLFEKTITNCIVLEGSKNGWKP